MSDSEEKPVIAIDQVQVSFGTCRLQHFQFGVQRVEIIAERDDLARHRRRGAVRSRL